VQTILDRAGYRVNATDDFQQAIQMIRVRTPDLLLTNVYLQGISGHDAMRKLKSEFPNLRVLMVSGLPDDSAIRDWIGEDRFDTFPKPFTAGALVEKVRQVLDGTSAAG
jgi:DNA-binding NtrC family response regulator